MSEGQKPSLGRVVHYRLSEFDCSELDIPARNAGEYRAAEVVRVFEPNPSNEANLHVKLDGANDRINHGPGAGPSLVVIVCSRPEGTEPGTWRWPPRV